MMLRSLCIVLSVSVCLQCPALLAQPSKPPITLDEYLNPTSIISARLSPDGTAAVIATETPDWKNNNYRRDLWCSGIRRA